MRKEIVIFLYFHLLDSIMVHLQCKTFHILLLIDNFGIKKCLFFFWTLDLNFKIETYHYS